MLNLLGTLENITGCSVRKYVKYITNDTFLCPSLKAEILEFKQMLSCLMFILTNTPGCVAFI